MAEVQVKNSLLAKTRTQKAKWSSGVAKLFDDRRHSFLDEVRNNTAGQDPSSWYYNDQQDDQHVKMSFGGL